ncbi:MAG: branched-chain amino acid ABC transporter substrate-binding protein [Gaiellaceae bacterium]
MRKGLIASALAVLVAAVVVSTAVARTAEPAAASQLATCTNVSLGMVGPLTGAAAFLGQEQLSWLQFGVQDYNKKNGTKFKVVQGDTQLKADVARTVAQRMVSNRNVMAVIGPSESQAVRSGGVLYRSGNLAAVSGSATAVDLTKGRPYRTFFRVVPNDAVQGPSIATYVAGTLKAKNVVVIDSQDDYSLPLANAISKRLRAAKVTVTRQSVAADDTDFSSVVTNVGSNVDVVVFATQVATAANTMSNQLREQGKRAIVFGSDGAYSPSQFKPRNGYVSVFAPDVSFDPSARKIVNAYKKWSKNKAFGAFGPATYVAGIVAMTAIQRVCQQTGNVNRAAVVAAVQRTNISSIISKNNIRFDGKGDVRGGTFAIYKITNGKYAPVK